jgi:hypothetical protein
VTLSFIPAGTAGHAAEPAAGSCVRENGGGRANLLENADYPVIAHCRICHGRIKLDYLLQAEWRHEPAGPRL